LRDRQLRIGEILLIVIDAHVAVIYRQNPVLSIELELIRNIRQERGWVWIEDIGFQGSREEGVIHAVEDVRDGSLSGKDSAVECRTRVSTLHEDDPGVILALKQGDDVFAGGK